MEPAVQSNPSEPAYFNAYGSTNTGSAPPGRFKRRMLDSERLVLRRIYGILHYLRRGRHQ